MIIRIRPRKPLTLLVAALTLSACGPTGFVVGMERLISNVVFGVPKPAQPQTPSFPPLLPPPSLPNLPGFQIPSGGPLAQPPCPTAPPGTPAVSAPTNVNKAAANGLYKWYSSYTRTSPSAGGATLSGFEDRKILNAKYLGADVSSAAGTSQTDYVYQWTEEKPDPFQVGYIDELQFQSHSYSNLDDPPSPTSLATVGSSGNYDPYGGIDLLDLQRYKVGSNGSSTLVEEFKPTQGNLSIQGQSFSGTPGLQLFTLPVPGVSAGPPVIGNPPYQGVYPPTPIPYPPYGNGTNQFSWQETATDATNQWTEVITAFEGNQRQTVDACGSIVYAWPVTATLQITKKDPSTGTPYTAPLTLSWTYDVAPQYGGIFVYESTQGDGGYGSTVKTVEVLGSLDIAPLPKGS